MRPEEFLAECKKIYCKHNGKYKTTNGFGDNAPIIELEGEHIHYCGDHAAVQDAHEEFDKLMRRVLCELGYEEGIKYVCDEIKPIIWYA